VTKTSSRRRVGRAAIAAAAFVLIRGAGDPGVLGLARAGDQLSTAELVARAEAIAVVDNTLDRKGAPTSWLKPPPDGVPVAPFAGVCVPDRALLTQWLASHKTHPGRATWQATLAGRHVEQVVFLRAYKGSLQPMCETEVMLGRSFATHPAYAAFRAELDALLKPAPAPAPAAPPASSPAVSSAASPPAPPVVPPPPEMSPTAPPPPPPSSGCL
jgi:hypothetical protein